MLQETVRRFVDRELIPIEQDSMDGPKLKAEVQESLEEKAKPSVFGCSMCRKNTVARALACWRDRSSGPNWRVPSLSRPAT